MMRTLALKIDADTYHGTREGIPRLVHCLKRHAVPATFLFSLGPDRTGRAIKRLLRPGFFRKIRRTSHINDYGIRALFYGTLLPAPDIGLHCATQMLDVASAGHEVGIHAFDPVTWQNAIHEADAATTERWFKAACERFQLIFKHPAIVHGAAGWQMNAHAIRLTQQSGFEWSSDTRGEYPFLPVVNAQPVLCPQLPTTLPTFDEMIGFNKRSPNHVVQDLLDRTQDMPLCGHVYTLRAEVEGGKFLYYFEQLLEGWKKQGYRFITLSQFGQMAVEQAGGKLNLPRHNINFSGSVQGHAGTLCTAGTAHTLSLSEELSAPYP